MDFARLRVIAKLACGSLIEVEAGQPRELGSGRRQGELPDLPGRLPLWLPVSCYSTIVFVVTMS